MAQTWVLSISAFYHDSADWLVCDGDIVAAAQEERFTRKKGDAGFPARAVEYCLAAGRIASSDLAYVGFYDKPLLKFECIFETYLSVSPRGFRSFLKAGPLWMKEKLYTARRAKYGRGWAATRDPCSSPSTMSLTLRARFFLRHFRRRQSLRWTV